MNNKDDELIPAVELAKRLKVSAAYIASKRKFLTSAKCVYGKKFYFRKSSLALGKNPDNPHETRQQRQQREQQAIAANNKTPKDEESSWTVTRGKENVTNEINRIFKETP